MSTNAERIEAYERFKRKHPAGENLRVDEPSWVQHQYDNAAVASLVIWLAVAVIAGVCAYGVWQHAQDKPWAVQVAEECEAQGKVPHVERGAAGKVLGVRCDVARP